MSHKVTFAAKAALDRKLEAGKAEAAAIFDRQFGEKFVPTSKAEREQAAKAALQRDVQRGRPTIVINQLTGKQLVGLPAARHLQDVNEATRQFNFQQRTQKDPLDPANRTLSRDESRAARQRDVAFSRKARKPKPRKQAESRAVPIRGTIGFNFRGTPRQKVNKNIRRSRKT